MEWSRSNAACVAVVARWYRGDCVDPTRHPGTPQTDEAKTTRRSFETPFSTSSHHPRPPACLSGARRNPHGGIVRRARPTLSIQIPARPTPRPPPPPLISRTTMSSQPTSPPPILTVTLNANSSSKTPYKQFKSTQGPVVLGRSSSRTSRPAPVDSGKFPSETKRDGDSIPVGTKVMSQRHAEISWEDGKYVFVKDLGSTNGTVLTRDGDPKKLWADTEYRVSHIRLRGWIGTDAGVTATRWRRDHVRESRWRSWIS